jgi:hypothetical protein
MKPPALCQHRGFRREGCLTKTKVRTIKCKGNHLFFNILYSYKIIFNPFFSYQRMIGPLS